MLLSFAQHLNRSNQYRQGTVGDRPEQVLWLQSADLGNSLQAAGQLLALAGNVREDVGDALHKGQNARLPIRIEVMHGVDVLPHLVWA